MALNQPDPGFAFDESKLSRDGGNQFIALDDPKVLTVSQVAYLDGNELVLGMTLNGESRAYPLQMTWYHHVINDRLGGKPITVTY